MNDRLTGEGANFVAIDFETANRNPNSACAIGFVQVIDGSIRHEQKTLLQVATTDFEFEPVHGISREMLSGSISFAELWSGLQALFAGASYRVVAHNATFDRRVMESCARRAKIRLPRLHFICTRNLSESVWGLRPADLATVCKWLEIPLRHHDPLSDARAAALIALAAEREKLVRLATGAPS